MNDRFRVKIILENEKNKLFFAPSSFWENTPETGFGGYPVEMFSKTPHAISTAGYPYTKSPFYTAPFVIVFKTNHAVEMNFLVFNGFLLPNSYSRILCLLTYDDMIDKFVPTKRMNIYLPYTNSLTLTDVLEFTIFDAHQKLVKFEDNSQLYISLTVL
jgi:hypothetical protein